MPKSAAYARIRKDVLAIVAAIPRGRLLTHAAIGAHLDVMPRHVAYLLAMLEPQERANLPWHRVVGKDGALGRRGGVDGRSQAELLAAEGVVIETGRVASTSLAARATAVDELDCGVPAQVRPPEATPPRQRRR
jgi:methylated-DNA-protein-cysteine methyltransferase-like protein